MSKLFDTPSARGLLWIAIAAIFMMICGVNVTPLHEWMFHDGAVFYTMGQAALRGKTLYLDIFDNKGPLLFFIQAFCGLIHSGKLGLYLLSTLWLGVSLELVYRIGRGVGASIKRSVCGIGFYLFFLMWCMWQGNTTEEWSMPFILTSIYILIKVCRGDNKWLANSFIAGLCFGLVFLINIINTAPILGVALYCAGRLLKERRIALFWRSLACFLAGAILPVLPVWLYFWMHGAFSEMIYGTIIINLKYKSVSISGDETRMVYNAIRLSACIVAPVVAYRRMRHLFAPLATIGIIIFISYLYSFGYCHYFLIESPLIILVWFMLRGSRRWIQAAVMVALLGCFYSRSHSFVYPIEENCSLLFGPAKEWQHGWTDTKARAVSIIPDDGIESVYILEGWRLADILNDRGATPVGRFFTGQASAIHFDPDISETVDREFVKASPEWVISCAPFEKTVMREHSKDYILVATEGAAQYSIMVYKKR